MSTERARSELDGTRPEPRFRGFSGATRRFLESLDDDPCPDRWPGGERAAYLAFVLTPLKSLVVDLKQLLSDVDPPLGIEPRVGASLFWTRGSATEECPVRVVRVWDRARSAEDSPVLYLELHAKGLEIGVRGEPADRMRRAARDTGLASRGWRVSAEEPVVSRLLPWEPWIDEPAFSFELADRFRELLPVFDMLRRPSSVPPLP